MISDEILSVAREAMERADNKTIGSVTVSALAAAIEAADNARFNSLDPGAYKQLYYNAQQLVTATAVRSSEDAERAFGALQQSLAVALPSVSFRKPTST